jgi:hypothetical protein
MPFALTKEADEMEQEIVRALRPKAMAENKDSDDPVMTAAYERLLEAYEAEREIESAKAVLRIRELAEGRIIRRTTNSLDLNGTPISSLPAFITVVAFLLMHVRELTTLGLLADQDFQEAQMRSYVDKKVRAMRSNPLQLLCFYTNYLLNYLLSFYSSTSMSTTDRARSNRICCWPTGKHCHSRHPLKASQTWWPGDQPRPFIWLRS